MMLLFLISFAEEVRVFRKKEGVGAFRENFEKYHGTFFVLLFVEEMSGGKFSIFSIKKVPAPTPPLRGNTISHLKLAIKSSPAFLHVLCHLE